MSWVEVFDLGNELRRVALDHLPDFRPELMEEVDPRIAANRRTKSPERRRSGSRPIWAVSRGDTLSHRSLDRVPIPQRQWGRAV